MKPFELNNLLFLFILGWSEIALLWRSWSVMTFPLPSLLNKIERESGKTVLLAYSTPTFIIVYIYKSVVDIENLCSPKAIFLICCSVRSRAIRKWNSHKTSSWVRGTWLSQLVTSFHIVTSLIRSFIQLVIQLIIHFLHLNLELS